MASWLFSRRVLRPLDTCFNLLLEEGMLVFYSLWGVSFRWADSRRKPITPAHGCAHGHVHLCREDGEGQDRAPHGRHLRKTPRLPPNDREPGLIRPTRHRLLASTVSVCPRARCASSERGSGYCPASTPSTAPVKTDGPGAGG